MVRKEDKEYIGIYNIIPSAFIFKIKRFNRGITGSSLGITKRKEKKFN